MRLKKLIKESLKPDKPFETWAKENGIDLKTKNIEKNIKEKLKY